MAVNTLTAGGVAADKQLIFSEVHSRQDVITLCTEEDVHSLFFSIF